MSLYVLVLPISGLVLFGVLFFGIATISRRNHINQLQNLIKYAPRREKEGMNR
jgi:hypothetical protein